MLGSDPEQRNEPSYLRTALEAVAEIKGISIEEAREVTLHNTLRLYGEALVG